MPVHRVATGALSNGENRLPGITRNKYAYLDYAKGAFRSDAHEAACQRGPALADWSPPSLGRMPGVARTASQATHRYDARGSGGS